MAMYEGAQTVVRTTEGDSKAFNVKVGLHQGSVLSLLLFVIVMEMISRELRAGFHLELLYADDLILMAQSEERLCDKIGKWKSRLESKGLMMNTGKTKVMFSCSMKDKVEEKGKWRRGVCKKGVGNNSILCHGCKKWVHKRCSGVKGSLRNASQSFICRYCKVDRPTTDGLLHLDIGNGVSLEKEDKFCYLGDMLDADGGCDSAVTTRVRSDWKKFRDWKLTGKGFSLKLRGKVYAT